MIQINPRAGTPVQDPGSIRIKGVDMRLLAASCILLCLSLPAPAGQRVDPSSMDRAPLVANPGVPEAAIAGSWDVWIPGAVMYSTDGRNVYQHYQPGAAMNRLEIAADGRYRWGGRSGRLEEVRPWHHQPGRRYYRLLHPSGGEYEFYRAPDDRLIVLFGGVGGHAATGTRLGGSTTAAAPPASASGAYAPGARVNVEWSGRWYPAQILQARDGRYLVRYDGYGSNWDEWVPPSRIRSGAGGSAPTGNAAGSRSGGSPAPAAGNPLGVQWQGGSSAAPAPTPASPGNPLGVEWQGGRAGAAPAAGASSTSNPLGVEWAGATPRPAGPAPATPAPTPSGNPRPNPPVTAPPVAGPAPTRPVPDTPPPAAPSSLVDRWIYRAAAFHDASGVTSEHLDTRGTLTLKPDGNYEQNLYIGGILNAMKGRYTLAGNRLTTHYSWRGQPASDDMQVQLSADGKTLTLLRQGSPTVYYTLERAE